MELINKSGRQIGIPGNPALIMLPDESVYLTPDKLKEYMQTGMVVGWLLDGILVVKENGVVKDIEPPEDWTPPIQYRPRNVLAPIKPKRKRKPRIKMRTEPKLVSHKPFKPLSAAEAAAKHNAEEAAAKYDAEYDELVQLEIRIMQSLAENPKTPAELCKELGLKSRRISYALRGLYEAKCIDKFHQSHKVFLTTEGERKCKPRPTQEAPNYVNMIDVHPAMDYRNQSMVARGKRRLRRYKGYTRKATVPVKPMKKYRFMDYVGLVGAIGHIQPDSQGSQCVPPEILSEAIRNDACVGIELLALGKPMGDIFNPEHWMYESTRDYFSSILTLSDTVEFA